MNLSHLGNVVPEGYLYYEKTVTPGDDLVLPRAYDSSAESQSL